MKILILLAFIAFTTANPVPKDGETEEQAKKPKNSMAVVCEHYGPDAPEDANPPEAGSKKAHKVEHLKALAAECCSKPEGERSACRVAFEKTARMKRACDAPGDEIPADVKEKLGEEAVAKITQEIAECCNDTKSDNEKHVCLKTIHHKMLKQQAVVAKKEDKKKNSTKHGKRGKHNHHDQKQNQRQTQHQNRNKNNKNNNKNIKNDHKKRGKHQHPNRDQN